MTIRPLFPVLLLHLCAAAQDPAPAPRPQEPAPRPQAPDARPVGREYPGPAAPGPKSVGSAAPVLVTMSFPGGTLADFCDAIRAKEPRANIVLAPLAAGARLPAMDLRGAGLDQALEGACAIAESAALIRIKDFRGAGEPVFTITAQEPVMTVGKIGPDGKMSTGSMPGTLPRTETTEVFSLNRLLDPKDGSGFPVTTVLSAIETATGDQALTAMRFHKESGLLIARGRAEQLGLVRDVLISLERDVMDRRKQDNAKKGIPAEPARETPK